jgi:hypothetical protein
VPRGPHRSRRRLFPKSKRKENPIQWAHCPSIATVRHLHHRRRTTPPKERERHRERHREREVEPGEVAPGWSPQIRLRPTSSSSTDDGSEGGSGRTREAARQGDEATLVGRGNGARSAAISPRPAATPRHEVRGELRREMGDDGAVSDDDLRI